ncbi:hypothetical protein GQ42DRAFT_162783 [Ramicandelaber brevisporus]|nr:hypothetical protein GQ42DRAFT_162783 [Ramicandelaber brevisporus]
MACCMVLMVVMISIVVMVIMVTVVILYFDTLLDIIRAMLLNNLQNDMIIVLVMPQ